MPRWAWKQYFGDSNDKILQAFQLLLFYFNIIISFLFSTFLFLFLFVASGGSDIWQTSGENETDDLGFT